MNKIVSGILIGSILVVGVAFAKTYAVVDGQEITDGDVAVFLKNPQIKLENLPEPNRKKVLDRIIDNKLLTKYAIKQGIESDKEYKIALEKVKENLALEIFMQKEFKKLKISDKEIKDFYNKNREKFQQPAKVKARHILVKTENEAKSLIKELNSASDVKAKFIELAKKNSIGPSKNNGGDLGWFGERQMVPAFSKAAFALKKGEYTKKPVKTQFGYHIIYVEDKKPAGIAKLKDVKNNIIISLKSKKFNEKMMNLAKSLREKAKVVIKK